MEYTLSHPLNDNYRYDYIKPTSEHPDKYYVRKFDSLDDYYNLVCEEHADTKNHSSHNASFSFTGTKNFSEAVELARYGWEKGLKDLNYYEDMSDKEYASKIHDNMWDVENQVTGSYVDVGAYLQGVPECMCEFVSKRTNTFADIVVNPTISCTVSTKTIMNRGREIIKLVDALEKRHIKTRVIIMAVVCSHTINIGNRYIVRVVAKNYNDILDQNRLVFPLAHPSFPRRLDFAMQELEKDIREDFGVPHGGYGSPGNIKRLPEELYKPELENSYVFMFDDVNHYDEEVKSVKKKIDEIVKGVR